MIQAHVVIVQDIHMISHVKMLIVVKKITQAHVIVHMDAVIGRHVELAIVKVIL